MGEGFVVEGWEGLVGRSDEVVDMIISEELLSQWVVVTTRRK